MLILTSPLRVLWVIIVLLHWFLRVDPNVHRVDLCVVLKDLYRVVTRGASLLLVIEVVLRDRLHLDSRALFS